MLHIDTPPFAVSLVLLQPPWLLCANVSRYPKSRPKYAHDSAPCSHVHYAAIQWLSEEWPPGVAPKAHRHSFLMRSRGGDRDCQAVGERWSLGGCPSHPLDAAPDRHAPGRYNAATSVVISLSEHDFLDLHPTSLARHPPCHCAALLDRSGSNKTPCRWAR